MHLLYFWFYSRMGDASRIQYFIFFVFDVNHEHEEAGWVQDFLEWPQGRFPGSSASSEKIGNVVWKRTVGVCLDCVWNLQPQVDIKSDFMTLKFEVGASNQKSYLYWSPNFAPDDLSSTDKGWKWGPYWVNVSPGLFSGGWGGVAVGCWNWMHVFGGLLLGWSKAVLFQKRFYFKGLFVWTLGSSIRVMQLIWKLKKLLVSYIWIT